MIKNLVVKTRLWIRNGRGPVLRTRNYVPGLTELKARATSESV